jgi:sulfite exporter TauE/SafE
MTDIHILLLTAAGLGFTHTILGPDHYVPFIVISKARNWGLSRTLFTTLYCGLGHVLSSVVIGVIGIVIGFGIENITFFESFRGNLAGWAFFIFGFVYMVWGIFKAVKNKPHTHIHAHLDGELHEHRHTHNFEHTHEHTDGKNKLTPWVLFIIFVLGPCEILVPLLMYPAAQHNTGAILSVSLLFSVVTISTMCAVVTVGYYGFKVLPTAKIDRFMHSIAGATICLSGFAILFLGL